MNPYEAPQIIDKLEPATYLDSERRDILFVFFMLALSVSLLFVAGYIHR